MAVSAVSIVEDFNVIEDIGARQFTGFVDAFFDAFFLQAAKERLSNGVIPAVPTAAHTGFQVVVPAKAQPVIAAVL